MQNQLNTSSGVTTHSTPDIWQEFVIFSIDDCEFDTPGNTERAFAFEQWCKLSGLSPVRLIGSYKGQSEHSWIIPAETFFKTAVGNEMAAEWCSNQESVLHLSKPEKRARAWRDANLLYQSGDFVGIGKFKNVTSSEAKAREAWTHNPNNGAYWICE